MGRTLMRVACGALLATGLTAVTAGVASAHSIGATPGAVCVDGGGWRASVTVSLDTNPGNTPPFTGSAASSVGTPQGFTLGAGTSSTLTTGILPISVTSVTFTVTGTFGDGFVLDPPVVVIAGQPTGCTATTTTTTTAPTTTTTAPTTTTTTPGTTTTAPGTTTTSAPGTTTTTVPGATTTTAPGTTTTVPEVLSITAITPICVRDAPFVLVTFGNQPQFNGRPATVTFRDVGGAVVATHTATFTAGTSVSFVYPGASVDAAGNPTDWPGWVFDGDEWVPDPTDAYLRDGLTVTVEVNPTATGQVAYPPATSSCADPDTSSTAPRLPTTGTDSTLFVWLGIGALLTGIVLVVRARRPVA